MNTPGTESPAKGTLPVHPSVLRRVLPALFLL